MVRPLKLGWRVPVEGRVEQEADGNWVTDRKAGAELEFSRRPRGNRAYLSMSGQNLGWACATARIKPGVIPGDKFSGSRMKAG
jgi:hypothetical protein